MCVGCMQCVTTATSSALTLLVVAGRRKNINDDQDLPMICLDALHFEIYKQSILSVKTKKLCLNTNSTLTRLRILNCALTNFPHQVLASNNGDV